MRVLLALLTAGLLFASPVWWASESFAQTQQAKQVQGAVKSVDPAKKMVTLEDGTMLMVSDNAKLKELKPGTKIKASYDEKGGQKVTTSIEVMK
jgi:Cu/Ag efflux protein CusF